VPCLGVLDAEWLGARRVFSLIDWCSSSPVLAIVCGGGRHPSSVVTADMHPWLVELRASRRVFLTLPPASTR